MGYELHITRKTDWSEIEGARIDRSEWEAIIESDSELTLNTTTQSDDRLSATFRAQGHSLKWDDGQIHAKNPDSVLITKMVDIARRLNAQVQGDDGEVYNDDGSTSFPDAVGHTSRVDRVITRIRTWLRLRQTSRILLRQAPRFRVGNRVKNLWGELGTVISVDLRANQGSGSVLVKLDDGRQQNLACTASGLQVVNESMGAS